MTHPDPSAKPEALGRHRDFSAPRAPFVIVVMGVSGSGKTTIGRALARALDYDFCEGDALHPRRNVDKMRRGQALTDTDRRPWLTAIRRWIDDQLAAGHSGVITCSALKRRYRHRLRNGRSEVRLLFLRGSHRLIAQRLRHRRGHFMPAALLDSQFETLQPPVANEAAVTVDLIYGQPSRITAAALRKLRLAPASSGIDR